MNSLSMVEVMNYFFIIPMGFAFIAMLHLSRKLEKQLAEVGNELTGISDISKTRTYTFQQLEERIYCITPCPPNFEVLGNLSNVIWVEADSGNLLIKSETWQCIEDLVTTLNSTVRQYGTI